MLKKYSRSPFFGGTWSEPATQEPHGRDDDPIRHEIVFVSDNVDGYEQLVESILVEETEDRRIDIVVLKKESDGVELIGESLRRYGCANQIHVISHGIDGAVNLGCTWLSLDNLEDYSEELLDWRESLSRDADIFLYGSSISLTDEGKIFLDSLSELTGATVISCSNDYEPECPGDWGIVYESHPLESHVD